MHDHTTTLDRPGETPGINGATAPALPDGHIIIGSTTEIALADLKVDVAYQRPLDQTFVARLARQWDPVAAGFLLVANRDGVPFLVDGQHRAEAMKLLGYTHAPCSVLPSSGGQEEAGRFRRANTVRRQQALGIFKADVAAGEPNALALLAAIQQAGWQIDYRINRDSREANRTFSIVALQRLFKRNPKRLTVALRYLAATWPDDPHAGEGRVIDAMFAFLTHADGKADPERFVERLAGENLTILIRRGLSSAQELALRPSIGIARAFAAIYNVKLPAAKRITLMSSE